MNAPLVVHIFQIDTARSTTKSVCEIRDREGQLLTTLESRSFWNLPKKLKTYLHAIKDQTGTLPDVTISFDNPYPYRIRMVGGLKPELIDIVNESLQFTFWLEFRRIRVQRRRKTVPVNR